MSESYTKSFDISTKIENLAEDEAFVSLPPSKIQVMVKGEGLQLLRLYYNPPEILIDATENQFVVLGAVQRGLPQNISVERTLPTVVNLLKEKKENKRVPILPRTEVSWPPTHDIVQDVAIFPDSLEISGAQSILENITHWQTELFKQDNVKDSLSVMVSLADTLQGLVEMSITQTRLSLVTAEFTEGSRVLDVHLKSMQENLTLDPPNIEVRYRVPLKQYQLAQDANDFLASVSYDALRDDTTGYITPELELPHGIWIRDVVIFPPKLRYYDVLVDE